MARYIDVSELPNFEVTCSNNKKYVLLPFERLSDIPTADVEEVKHGYWIKGKRIGINMPQYICSQCGKWEDAEFPYCNCGAKMDGGKI